MTTQELFDSVVSKMLLQGKKSKLNDKCVYRGTEGRKCPVGFAIPDELYDPRIEGCSLARLDGCPAFINIVIKLGWTLVERNMLCELQQIHDGFIPGHWKHYLKGVAKKYKLEWNHENIGR